MFSEKIHPPLPMAVDAVFFPPRSSFFHRLFLVTEGESSGLVAKFRNENIDQK